MGNEREHELQGWGFKSKVDGSTLESKRRRVPKWNSGGYRWIGYGPGGITLVVKLPPKVMPSEPIRRYDRERLSDLDRSIGNPPDLAGGHLLSHVKQKLAVAFFNATHKSAEFAQKTSLFPGAAPNDIVSALALRKVGQNGRFFSVIEELIKRDLQSARHFLERFDGRDSMAIFHARNIATKQPGALFDVPLGVLFFFAQGAKPITDNHVGIVS